MIGEQPESRYRFAINKPRAYLHPVNTTTSSASPERTSTTRKRPAAAGQQVNPLQAFHSEQQQIRTASLIDKTNQPAKPH